MEKDVGHAYAIICFSINTHERTNAGNFYTTGILKIRDYNEVVFIRKWEALGIYESGKYKWNIRYLPKSEKECLRDGISHEPLFTIFNDVNIKIKKFISKQIETETAGAPVI